MRVSATHFPSRFEQLPEFNWSSIGINKSYAGISIYCDFKNEPLTPEAINEIHFNSGRDAIVLKLKPSLEKESDIYLMKLFIINKEIAVYCD